MTESNEKAVNDLLAVQDVGSQLKTQQIPENQHNAAGYSPIE